MSSFRAKALGYYRDQRLHVIRVETPEGSIQPTYVEALVKGFRSDYRVVLEAGVWRCSGCGYSRSDCAHRAAVQLATGHKSAAAKPDNKTAASAATPAATTPAHHR